MLENKVPFIKPITDSCFYKVNGKFVNYQKEDLTFRRIALQFLPDFIEFSENKIDIVEVSEEEIRNETSSRGDGKLGSSGK